MKMSNLNKFIAGLTSPHLEGLVQDREDKYLPQSVASPLEDKRKDTETGRANQPDTSHVLW